MAQNDVIFVKGQGGLGRPLPGSDYVSGMNFYTSALPSGFSSSSRIKQVFSILDAENLGILDDYSDETKGTGTYLVTGVGAAGDVVKITFLDPQGVTQVLCNYTVLSTDTTVTLLGASIAAAINLGTTVHGWTATAATGTVTMSARPGLGIFPNSGTNYVVTITGTVAGTLTQSVVAGIASRLAIYHYHISEYFRIQPQGNLYVGMYAVPGTYDFADVQLVQNYAEGKIRQFAVFIDSTAFSTTHVTAAQTMATTLAGLHRPLNILIGGNINGTADVGSLTDLSTLASNNVSVVIGQDGAALGFSLYKSFGKSITCLGATLGAVSLAKVSDDIAWVGKFNLSNGVELNVPAYANGQFFSIVTQAKSDQVNLYRYIFVKTFVDTTGTYFNDSHCATTYTSDYAYIENNRTIDKAIRNIRPAVLPLLNSPLTLNEDGTMDDNTVATFETAAEGALSQMLRDQELSAINVTVNPDQNVLTTSKVIIAVELVPVGVARNIQVNIGFVVSI